MRPSSAEPAPLADFTYGTRDLRLIPLAAVVSAMATGIAVLLVAMIGLVTNLVYYGRLSTSFVPPPSPLGLPRSSSR